MPDLLFTTAIRRFLRSGALCTLLLAAASAFAILGEDVASVQSDQVRLNARIRVAVGPAYSVHELVSSSGTTVREFVSSGGTVFGLWWQGPFTPDLRQLLGTHFEEYRQASQSVQGHVAHMVRVETGDLVIESAGHMRFSIGRAYLRSKMPNGVTADALR